MLSYKFIYFFNLYFMEINVYDLNGNIVKKVELPKIFSEELREDLVQRAFLSIRSKKRNPYGTDPLAGKRTAAHYHGHRPGRTGAKRWGMMGREMARMPRLHGKTVPFLMWEARFVPQARKGRRAHPPKVEKIWEEKINYKEKIKALRSAFSFTKIKDFVINRGHKIQDGITLPIVVVDDLEKIKKTKELKKVLINLKLEEELERIKEKTIRSGKGKMRGRRYKIKKGPLILINKDDGIKKAAKNISGIDCVEVENVNVELLAPGGKPGRLLIITESALEKLNKLWNL